MYRRGNRSSYRSYIRRRRLIIFAVALVVAGGAAAAAVSVRHTWRFSGAARGERREIVRFWEAGSYEAVYDQSRAALVSRPLDYFLLTMHGFSAYQLGVSQINSLNAQRYFDDCLWALRKALLLKNAANDGRLYYVLGKAYNYKGESYADLAVKYLEKARDLSYNAADIPEYLGMAYAAIGDYPNSVAALAEALVAQGQGVDDRPSGILLLTIARSYLALEEFEQARAYLQRCIDVSPDSRNILAARLLLSEVLQKMGDNEGARQQLAHILGEAGENAEAHYRLGELYALEGESTRARAEWRLALMADPAHREARKRLSL